MTRWATVLGLLVMACGGGAEPKSANDYDDDLVEDPATEGDVDMGDDVGAQKSDQASDESGAASDSGEAASSEDVVAVLQAVIDDQELDPYLRLEEPGRFPLKISGSGLPSGLELVKATKPVEVVSEASDKDAVLVFTSIDVGAKKANVRYRYDIEGMRGSAIVEKIEGRWQLKSSRLSKY